LIKDILAIIGSIASILSLIYSLQLYLWRRQLTWNDSLRSAADLLADIQGSGWDADVVVGLGRSGGIWAGWLAGNLGSKPFAVVDDKYTPEVEFPGGAVVLENLRNTYPAMRRMLVVEGASSTGDTFRTFQGHFAEALKDMEVRFAVLYKSPLSKARIDYVGEDGPEPWPARFPWHGTALYRPYLRDLFPRTARRNAGRPKGTIKR
jgi:hypoxanthine phosphoribosyltransferase